MLTRLENLAPSMLGLALQQLRAAAEVDVPMLAVACEGLRSLPGFAAGSDARLG